MARITSGQSIFRLLLIALPCALLAAGVYLLVRELRDIYECHGHLRSIFRSLELYEMERGILPKLAYFPDDPMEDPDSLRVVLESYGAVGSTCVCPALPDSLRELGLTYIWNVRLDGRKMPRDGERDWVLVEINALSDDVPAPHLGWHHVLYSDGTVERVKNPHARLTGL